MSRDTHVGSPDISEARVHLMATEPRLKLCSSGLMLISFLLESSSTVNTKSPYANALLELLFKLPVV